MLFRRPQETVSDEVRYLRSALERAEARNASLVQEIVNLRRDGFVAPTQPHIPDTPRGAVVSEGIQEVVDRIVRQSPSPDATRTGLLRFIAGEQMKQTPEAVIIAKVIAGDAGDGYEDDE